MTKRFSLFYHKQAVGASNEAKGITKERGYVVMITNELMLA